MSAAEGYGCIIIGIGIRMRLMSTKSKPIKFTHETYSYIVELGKVGADRYEVAEKLGVSYWTLSRWFQKYEGLKDHYNKAKSDFMRSLVAKKLRESIQDDGIVEKEEWIEEDERGAVKKTRTKRAPKPDIQALKMLAAKYAPGEYAESEESNVTIKIGSADRALSLEERVKLLGQGVTTRSQGTESQEGED